MNELRKLANRAIQECMYSDFYAAAGPDAVIALLDEIDRLTREAVAADIRIGNDALVIAGLTAERDALKAERADLLSLALQAKRHHDKVVAELEMSKMKTYAASISPIAKERDELRAALAERDAKGKTMIDFKLQATGIPESIEQYQLALDAAFTAGKAIAAGAAPPNVLMNQLINDKVELQHKLDDALHKAEAERDAALADAKRLEWLSQQGVSFGFQDIHEGNKWEIGGPYATLRIAIDAEMKGEQPWP